MPQIIYEDDDLLILNKPAGLIVNRSETVVDGETLQDWLEQKYELGSRKYELESEEFGKRSGIVHRLDKDTSGIIVVAKNPQAFFDLQKQFKERGVRKTYCALVHGWVKPPRGEIAAPVGRDPKNRQRFAVVEDGRGAITRYRVLGHYTAALQTRRVCCRPVGSDSDYTLLELEPLTGRTHQIRVHLNHINHPIVADPWYAGRKTSRLDNSFCPRLFLHAQSLGLFHPATGAWMKFEADLPEELEKVLQNLEKKEDRGV